MKVFILHNGCYDNYDSNEIYGVYSTREVAEMAHVLIFGIPSFIDTHEASGEITEWEVDAKPIFGQK